MRRITKIVLVLLLFILYTINGAKANVPESSAKAAILMDAGSGRVLWGKNIHTRLPMASTTKIMTAIVAIEYGNLNDTVTVSETASGIEGSSIWLSPGEEHTLEDLLYGLMLRSGNDAAVAIAQHVGGSVEEFVCLMNKKAAEIGAKDTHFVNPHGLHDDNHYTTAYDLALIASYALKNRDFERIVSTKYKTIPWPGHKWDRAMKNKNKLLWQYEGANGVKTGFTKKAGRCLVASARREGLQLVAVVLNCGPMFEECMELMDYGFEEFKSKQVCKAGDIIGSVCVKDGKEKYVDLEASEDFSIALRENERAFLDVKIEVPQFIFAPVCEGQKYGIIKIFWKESLIKEIPLVAARSVEKETFFDNLEEIIKRWIQ